MDVYIRDGLHLVRHSGGTSFQGSICAAKWIERPRVRSQAVRSELLGCWPGRNCQVKTGPISNMQGLSLVSDMEQRVRSIRLREVLLGEKRQFWWLSNNARELKITIRWQGRGATCMRPG